VGSGLSNRQIAEKLVISVRTVDAHVDHIFGKLGVSSRADLTTLIRQPPGSAPLLTTAINRGVWDGINPRTRC